MIFASFKPLILRAIGGFLSIFLIVILSILEKFYRIRIVNVTSQALGHMLWDIDIYLRQRSLERTGLNPIFILSKPANSFAAELLSRYVFTIRSDLLCRIFYTMEYFLQKTRFIMVIPNYTYRLDELGSNGVKLTVKEQKLGAAIVKKFGITSNDWFIGFHCRDRAFHLQAAAGVDKSYHDYRNSDIILYKDALEEVVSRGGYCVRLGKGIEKRFVSDNPRIIDREDVRTDFLDVWLSANAKFFICGISGIFDLARLFNTPYGVTNATPYGDMSRGRNSLYIPKFLRRKGMIEPLSFREIRDMGLITKTSHRTPLNLHNGMTYEKLGLEWVENSAEDIRDLCLDMFDLVEGRPTIDGGREAQEFYRCNIISHIPESEFAGQIGPRFAVKYSQLMN